MSAIPPNSIVSVLQSGVTQRQQSRIDDAERSDRDRRARQIAARADGILEVEATDDDTQVHADAEGSGGSGRNTREPAPEEDPSTDQTDDADGLGDEIEHLDLTA